jgi:hypothetical protein
MQKSSFTLFVVASLSICFSAKGQNSLTLTGQHNAYRAGDQIVKQQVEYKDPGSSGRNLTWDFSMLQSINEEYTLDYLIPDSSRMDTICGMEHRTRYYYRQSNDSLWAVGFENATTLMRYTIPELRMKYPFTYGDTLFSRFKGVGEYSQRLKLKVKGYTRTEVDAEGELKLPDFESVKKALRVHTQRYYTQTGKDSLEMTLDTYSWYADGVRYPVFESVKTNLIKRLVKEGEQAMDTTVFTTSFYYPPEKQVSTYETTTTDDGSSTNPLYQVFTEASYMPNPVEDDLLISYKLTREANVWFSLQSSTGLPIRNTSPQIFPEGYNTTTIRMGSLIPGSYTLYVHVDDMMVKQVIVKK